MHVESIVDDCDVDALPDDSLLPHARHVDRVLRHDSVDEVPLLRPQRVEDLELGRHGCDQACAESRIDDADTRLLRVSFAEEREKGSSAEFSRPGLGRGKDGKVALDSLTGVLALE